MLGSVRAGHHHHHHHPPPPPWSDGTESQSHDTMHTMPQAPLSDLFTLQATGEFECEPMTVETSRRCMGRDY